LGATYGNGIFVAGTAALVGGEIVNGPIFTSPSGVVWTSHPAGALLPLIGVAFGGGLFSAVGINGATVTSAVEPAGFRACRPRERG